MNPNYKNYLQSLSPSISYHSDQEYRNHLRRIFRFSPEKKTYYANLKSSDIDPEEIDPQSKDEMDLDMDALEEGMEMIFLATSKNPNFHTLYEYAAARMFSTDPKIGQAVLCSYDTFAWYFSCVWHHLLENDIDKLPEYQQLCSWFSVRNKK